MGGRCAWRSSSVLTRPWSTGSPGRWPGSAGWVSPSPAGSTRRRCSALAVRALGADARRRPPRGVAQPGRRRASGGPRRRPVHRRAQSSRSSTHEGDRPAYRANGPDRCFHCKDELFTTHLRRGARPARARRGSPTARTPTTCGGPTVPAARAATRPPACCARWPTPVSTRPPSGGSPRALALPCADKPAAPCLASRIPHHEPVTPEKLAQVEAAETALRTLGFADCRVRHHGDVARVELPADD